MSHNSKYYQKSFKRTTVKSRNLVDMFKNVAHQLNATECESINASEDSSPSASKIAKDDFSSGTENASDSASFSEQSIEINSTPGSGAAEARHEDKCFSVKASDSASSSKQSNEIDSIPGSGAAEARHEDECFSASTNCSKELSDISLNKGKDI
jgi:hypothetical protein